jgi:hypothetical protein
MATIKIKLQSTCNGKTDYEVSAYNTTYAHKDEYRSNNMFWQPKTKSWLTGGTMALDKVGCAMQLNARLKSKIKEQYSVEVVI